MAKKGYWAICEEVANTNNKGPEPDMCLVFTEGFFYSDVMAPTRFEAIERAKQKLRENIKFLNDCYNDLPPISESDSPPSKRYKDGVILAFVALDEIGLREEDVENFAA